MSHYICLGGCKGESEESGICQDIECTRHDQSLFACDCENGHHDGAFDDTETVVSTPLAED